MNNTPVEALTELEAAAELEWLAQEIARHNRLYHTEDQPEISDAEYDALVRRNAAIESFFPHLIRTNSPSRLVGGAPAGHLAKVVHVRCSASTMPLPTRRCLSSWRVRGAS